MTNIHRSIFCLAILAAPCLHASTVEEIAGNIYVRAPNANSPKQISNGGHDRDPALSPDGRRIVFVRDLLGDRDYNDFNREGPSVRVMQLWLADAAGARPPRLLLDSPAELQDQKYSGFYSPQFSGDGRSIYFMVQCCFSSGAIARLPVAGGKPSYITDALDFAVLPAGKYQGDLAALQHRHKLAPGTYDWYYLLKPDGQPLGVIGQDLRDVFNFVNDYVPAAGCIDAAGVSPLACINRTR